MTPTDYLSNIITPILTSPQGFSLVESNDQQGKLFTCRVSKVDMGRVIGKEGATIKAIRLMMHTFASRTGENINIKVTEPIN